MQQEKTRCYKSHFWEDDFMKVIFWKHIFILHIATLTKRQLISTTFNLISFEIVFHYFSLCHVDFGSSTCVKICEQVHDDCQHVDPFLYCWTSAEYVTSFALSDTASICLNFMFSLGG